MENGNRTQSVDIAKGILIILVVVAHAQADIVHDIIFIFHMPLDVCSLGRSSSNGGLLVHNLFPLYAVFAFYFIKEIFR